MRIQFRNIVEKYNLEIQLRKRIEEWQGGEWLEVLASKQTGPPPHPWVINPNLRWSQSHAGQLIRGGGWWRLWVGILVE